ncbi:MAG TPA: 3-methyl-2-oxobutanoate hydroxymethyltransferase, partial [Nitrospiria bacterium]|nr:3-methyl-2-oxobutanoate hydroxymethyltransferase [Nitrospiria bacterium]
MARITIPDILRKKEEGKKIIMLTAYDYPFAKIVDEAGMDIVLVGDSLGMVVQGRDTTLSVTMEEMLYHTRMVTSAVKNALVIADMPFLSNQMGVSETIKNAGRFLKEARAAGVKLEGGVMVADQIRALVRAEIPVMAHVGMTPQSIHRFGGYKVQGKEKRTALKILEDATAV